MMEYIKLFWEDAPEGEPSVILYEVDTENERLALHSIDIFADGRTRNIPDLYDSPARPRDDRFPESNHKTQPLDLGIPLESSAQKRNPLTEHFGKIQWPFSCILL